MKDISLRYFFIIILVLALLGLIINDFSLHLFELLGIEHSHPFYGFFWFFPSREAYTIFWTVYWGVASFNVIVLGILLWLEMIRKRDVKMSSTTKEKDAVGLFNEKASELANSNFVKYILEHKKISFEVSVKRGERVKLTRTIPNEEAIKAFVLTFRFFIQNNERCSFGNLDKIYARLPVPKEIKKQFRTARKTLNEYLDSSASFTIENEMISRRKLLDVVVYGGLAHATPEKKKLYDKWMRDPITRGILEVHFATTLFQILKIIKFVEKLNVEAIKVFG